MGRLYLAQDRLCEALPPPMHGVVSAYACEYFWLFGWLADVQRPRRRACWRQKIGPRELLQPYFNFKHFETSLRCPLSSVHEMRTDMYNSMASERSKAR